MRTSRPSVYAPAQESTAPLAHLPVRFVGSFPDATHRLSPARPEIALLGRSNVGKSSLLNALLGRSLARVSGRPGRTAFINVFELPTLYLLDLPGYGFTRVSQGEQRRYQRLIQDVLVRRKTLTAVLWLLDIRHDPTREDLAHGDALAARGLPVLVALTKADKLPFAQRRRRLQALQAMLALPEEQLQLTSSTSGEGLGELGESLLAVAPTKEGPP
ncbi:MAG TPA: ribosome biogenesis GTP-binding protein YihA/YsxC [Gemmatimonadales bacterium]|nr:ribosome biogenesis GTP-binding protein YihA/YsxC [Gemmatimonadales bacterium]